MRGKKKGRLEINTKLIVIWLKSADNPSDAPSGFEEINDDRCVKGIISDGSLVSNFELNPLQLHTLQGRV